MTATDPQPTRDRLTIAVHRTTAERALQVQLSQTDAAGSGFGYRLAGPKHYNSGTTELLSRDLNADDAAEIRKMLDAAFPPPAQPLNEEFPATQAGGHALVIEFGDEELIGNCQCGESFSTQTPDKSMDRFARRWERHVMTLGR